MQKNTRTVGMGMGMGWGICCRSIERDNKDDGDGDDGGAGDGAGWGMCYRSLFGQHDFQLICQLAF